MSSAIVFLLFAISGDNAPDLTSLAVYPTREACQTALAAVEGALAAGADGKHLLCISSDSLEELGQKNGVVR